MSGFKSLKDEPRIEVRPLTVLAGANSSGKSSMTQPLLLRQTIEASFEPETPVFLNGVTNGSSGGGGGRVRRPCKF